MRLWYKKPAENWNAALPLGNGRQGAMVFGGVEKEQLQLNEDSLWYGGPTDRHNPDAAEVLPRIRQYLADGKYNEANRLALLALTSTPDTQRHYESLGDLFISQRYQGTGELIKNDEGARFKYSRRPVEYTAYERSLDLSEAIAHTSYTIDGVTYEREYFASYPNGCIALRFTANKPGRLNLDCQLTRRRGRFLDEAGHLDGRTICTKGQTGGNGVAFAALLRGSAKGGRLYTVGEHLVVEKADEVTLILTAATTFRCADAETDCHARIDAVSSYAECRAKHIADYRTLFDKAELVLGEPNDAVPTDERLAAVSEGVSDAGLTALYFAFGRYLMIAGSRPGSLPLTLQGIWNDQIEPPWDSKYTININTEMNYWPVDLFNTSDCAEPFFELLERMRPNGIKTAKLLYGARGFCCHHNTDIWADTAPQDATATATYWPMGAAWFATHIFEHYLFTGDRDFLAAKFETMKEAAIFFADFLVEDAKGRLVTSPSVSPENSFVTKDGQISALCAGPSMDSQIIATLLNQCLAAAEILGAENDICIAELKSILPRLPQPEIGSYGQLMEWSEDYEEAEPGHRHISHLFALYPSELISVSKTPELAKAARVTLERRLASGGGHTGWSRAWIINLWARLLDGVKVGENIHALLAKSTMANLFDNHPPFQIDGNFGGAAGIAEALLQSHGGVVSLLPALPPEWKNGSFSGFKTRCGVEVSAGWSEGKLTYAKLEFIKSTFVSISTNGIPVTAEGQAFDGNIPFTLYGEAGNTIMLNACSR